MNLETNLIEQQIQEVTAEYLHRMTGGDGTLLRQVEEYATSRSGKMLRPRLLLAAYHAVTHSDKLPRRTLLLAVAVEMLHNASLLHDDVIDRDLLRRGQPSVNARWNNSIAVLVGDYHLASIMLLLDEIDNKEISRKFIHSVRTMIEAELLQQEVADGEWTKEKYLKVIDGKTANLFALAAELGSYGDGMEGIPAFRDYGTHYGRLFQLRDDLADNEATPFTNDLIEQEKAILDAIKL